MRIRTLGLLLTLGLILPSSALADGTVQPPPPGQPQIFAQSEPKPGFGAIEVDVDCEQPAHPGETDCSTKLQLIVNGTIVDERVVTVPLDGNDVVYDVDVSAIRDKALAATGKMRENLKAFSADGSVFLNQTPRDDSAFDGWNIRTAQKCLPGRIMRDPGGVVTSKPGSNVPTLTFHDVIPSYFSFTTGDAPVRTGFNGLAYSIEPHTTARFDCVTFFTSAGPVLVPTLIVLSGGASVGGKPQRQIAAAIVTPEATFRSLKPERVGFRVVRDARKHISQMTVSDGKTLQATHLIGTGNDFPCTPGRTVKVGRHGIIK